MDIQNKQKEAYLQAYDTYADELYRFCLLRTSDTEVASDILQETFTKVWLYISEGKNIQNMRAFLYQVMRNLIIDFYRKKKPFSLDEMVENGAPVDIHNDEDIDISVDTEYEIETVMRFLETLPPSYQEVIILRYVEDMSIPEISDSIGESENNVSVRLHRAVKKLQQILETEKKKYG